MPKGTPRLSKGPKPRKVSPVIANPEEHFEPVRARRRAQIAARLRLLSGKKTEKKTCQDEILRDFERWVDGGCDWREILFHARIIVDYYKTPKGKRRPASKVVGKYLGPMIARFRKWRDDAPEPTLKKVFNTYAEQLESWAGSSKVVSRDWYGSGICNLVDSIKASGEKQCFKCSARLLKYLGAPITRIAVMAEYRRNKPLATKKLPNSN